MKRSNETNFLKFLVEHGFKIGAVFNKEAVESSSNLKGYIVCMLPKTSEEPMNDTQIKNLKSLLDKNDYHCDKVLPPTLFTFLYNESGYVKKLTGKNYLKMPSRLNGNSTSQRTKTVHSMCSIFLTWKSIGLVSSFT